MILTQIEYNRNLKKWQAINGQTTSFPPGPGGKEQAQIYALSCDNADLYHEVEALIENNALHPKTRAIETRTIKAGLLVLGGHLLPPNADRQAARCRSQSRAGIIHSITKSAWDKGLLECSCEDFQRSFVGGKHTPPTLWSGQVACKHIIAVSLAEALTAREEHNHYDSKDYDCWHEAYDR